MITKLWLLGLLVALLVLSSVNLTQSGVFHPDAQSPLVKFEWLVGTWKQVGDETTVMETWKSVSPQTYEGRGVTSKQYPKLVIMTEVLHIVAMGGDIFYIAKVEHNEFPVPFKLIEMENGQAIFENKTHDFPQRISYKLTIDGELDVIAEGSIKGETRRLEFHFTKEK